MVFLIRKNKIRITDILGLISGLFIISCASGPVTTQIDIKKNSVVDAPSQFQSPTDAIDGFLNLEDAKALKDPLVSRIRTGALTTLLRQLASLSKELKQSGRLQLQPGQSYEFSLESFCVNAGVERPVRGDGLFLGDIQGAAKSWLPVVLNKYQSLGITQEDAQVLVWSLLSKIKFDQLNTKSQAQLLKIFPDAPVRFGNDYLEDKATDFLFSQASSELITAKEQFDKYREILQDTKLKYSEMEQILSPHSSRSQAIDVGWLKHEDGYFIHLQADGYQQVRVKIYAPIDLKKDTFFDPTKHVALPGQGQRLALSNNVIDQYGNKFAQIFKDKLGISAAEALFILKHPVDSYSIYEMSQKALHLTWAHQKSSTGFEDDRADAFRHFIWAGLATASIGPEKAREYLTAHEDYPGNNAKSKSMNLFNNNKGINYSQQYKGNSFEEDLIKEAQEKIRDRELR